MLDSSVDEYNLLVACVFLTYTMQVTTFPTELSYKHMCYSLIPGHWCPTGKCVNYDGEHRSTLLHEEPSGLGRTARTYRMRTATRIFMSSELFLSSAHFLLLFFICKIVLFLSL